MFKLLKSIKILAILSILDKKVFKELIPGDW